MKFEPESECEQNQRAQSTQNQNSDDKTRTPSDIGNSGTSNQSIDCVFKAGGWCELHARQARKTIVVARVWDRKKSGLFSYVTRKRAKYLCEIPVLESVKFELTDPSVNSEVKNVLEHGRLWVEQQSGLVEPADRKSRKV